MRRLVVILALAIPAMPEAPSVRAVAESPRTVLGTTSLSGRVLDSTGTPVEGALVDLHPFNRPFTGKPGQWGESVAETRTDRDGRFRFVESDRLSFANALKRMFMVTARHTNVASAFRTTTVEDGEHLTLDLVLARRASLLVEVRDETAHTVRNASLRGLHVVAESGEFDLRRDDLRKFGLPLNVSDEAGRLKLPDLPDGAAVDVAIEHPDFAPIDVKGVVHPGAVIPATMRRGVPVTLTVAPSRDGERISYVTVYTRRERTAFGHPSMMWFERLEVSKDGSASFTADAGSYSILHLYHEDFYLTNSNPTAEGTIQIDRSRENVFSFQLHRKTQARGRVVDAVTGEPVKGMSVDGEISSQSANGKENSQTNHWSYVSDAETDDTGAYMITLAAGQARVSASGRGKGYIADGEPVEVAVAADGTGVFPDLKVRRLPKVTGTVYDPKGKPLDGAIVRLRGDMNGVQPAVTDAQGRFEVIVPWLRYNHETNKPLVVQPLVTFHPFKPLSARVEVRLDDPTSITDLRLTLEPHPCESLLTEFVGEMSDWERGIVPAERVAELTAQSLKGQTAPEVDGAIWFNAPRESMRLADFRGRYVSLDFWTTTCGPCHGDFPKVKLLQALYADRGFTVIGIHDNSVAPEAVREHAREHGLTFPVVVDTADGRIMNRYKSHGVASFPSYILIGPDGSVLHHEGVLPEPSLDDYMLEIVRDYLIQ